MIKLSICIPSIPNRLESCLTKRYDELMSQVGDEKDIEILSLVDNKVMSIGRKKNLLIQMARGKYVTVLDDDDHFSENYIQVMRKIIQKIIDDNSDIDVLCYWQKAIVNNVPSTIKTSIHHEIEKFKGFSETKRPPWQWCAWKTELAKSVEFTNTNWAEDSDFTNAAVKKVKTELIIPKILHYYNYSGSDGDHQQFSNKDNFI